MRIGGGSVGSSHALLDPINQGRGQCALRLLLAGQRHFGQRTRQCVVGAVAALGVCPLQCHQQLLSQRVGGRPGTGLLDQLHACIAQQLTVAADFGGLRQHRLQQLAYFGGRGIGLSAVAKASRAKRRCRAASGAALDNWCSTSAAALAGQAVGVDFPAVVAQHLPVFCGQSVRRGQCRCQGGGDGAAAPGRDGQRTVNSAASLPPATRSVHCAVGPARSGWDSRVRRSVRPRPAHLPRRHPSRRERICWSAR